MSKKQFKSQASSGRAVTGFGFGSSGFGSTQASALSYIQETPDYLAIEDANVVVAFKNLSKKDSTTKAKALEDIQAYVSKPDIEVEEGLLEAWVKLYPRLSIDSARRVRQLAHGLNGSVCSKCGKRIARHLSKLAGAWLAGCYDSDRAAARAAQDALGAVFPNREKVASLKKSFQSAVLEYCRDAALHETVQTLSDERTVSKDDAEATYARVVATSLAVVTNLLSDLPAEEIAKQESLYEDVLGQSRLWDFACHADAGVRRSTHRLLQVALQKQPLSVEANRKAVSAAYVYKGLPSDQSGSSIDYVAALNALTTRLPSIWTDDYSGKKPAVSRLRQFLKHGSRSGSSDFWMAVQSLLSRIPETVWPKTYDEAKDLLVSARDGVSRKEERFTASSAWPSYFSLVSIISTRISVDDRGTVLENLAVPILRQYLHPSPDTSDWVIHGAKTAHLVARATRIPHMETLLEREWPQLADQLLELAKTSQPQQSKDFEKSQLQVASAGERWAALQRELYTEQLPETLEATFLLVNIKITKECTQLLKTREGKPFGAAAVIEELVRNCGHTLLKDVDFRAALEDLLRSDDCKWVLWPSSRHIARCLFAVSSDSFFAELFTSALSKALASGEPTEVISRRVTELFPRNAPHDAVSLGRDSAELQSFVRTAMETQPNDAQRSMFLQLYNVGVLAEDALDEILTRLINTLGNSSGTEKLRSTLTVFSEMDDRALMASTERSNSEDLLPSLIRLEQHEDDEIAQSAADISARISKTTEQAGSSAKFGVVLQNLEAVSQKSLSMSALVDLFERLLGNDRKIQHLEDMLPDLDVWKAALVSAIRPPKPSLAFLSPLGGVLHLVQAVAGTRPAPVRVDEEGLSQALRIAIYVQRLLADTDAKEKLADFGDKWTVLALLYLTILLAEGNLSVVGTNALWHPASGVGTETEALDYISGANTIFNGVWDTMMPTAVSTEAERGQTDHENLLSALKQIDPRGGFGTAGQYYIALAEAKITSNLYELHGHNAEQARASETELRNLRSSKDTIAAVSCIVGVQQPLAGSQTLTRFSNELVADLTGLDISDQAHEHQGLTKLITLNAILQTQDDVVATIAKQRLIFLVKRFIEILKASSAPTLTAEICKALTFLLAGIHDMYGEHWTQLIAYVANVWMAAGNQDVEASTAEDNILVVNATLKLFATLRKISKSEEPNDDLVDALKASNEQLHDGLVTLLKSANGVSDEMHQPLMITHEQLARLLSQMPHQALKDPDELFPLMYTQSRSIQQGAFDLLHKHIPAAQEQVSFEAALENKAAHLPDELLSLILEAPTLDSLIDASFDRGMPLQLQGYLYSWRLLFDHFNNSSYRVKTDYIEQLKEGTYLAGLLSFTFDFLGHTRGKPIDASKFETQEYVADTEPNPERDVQWLLTHLFYLALTHLPSSVKSYYLDIRSRQTSLAVESWTAKYISPLVISQSLQSVAEWSEKSVKEDPEYEKMTVKAGMRSKEINVGYVVDEQTMAIKVVLPEAYPLASAQVVGVSRVAVKEEKWQTWLRNCQGVITFSNGSITDGLSAWRKNVTGALKGQTECAICYSIIDSQKQLPTKRCPTCRNLFHGTCLFKWFRTSNASTCPLCRNPFNFT